MDNQNRYAGRGAYLHLRLEALLGLAVAVAFAVRHLLEIRGPQFALLFAWIDIAGYLPGAVAFRLAHGKPISRLFPALYNVTHSFLANALVALVWCVLFGPEWALLALPLHLLGDRALFGNFFKSYATPFEPCLLPEFAAFEQSLDTRKGIAS